jgi:hypothetical protein
MAGTLNDCWCARRTLREPGVLCALARELQPDQRADHLRSGESHGNCRIESGQLQPTGRATNARPAEQLPNRYICDCR